MRHGLMQQLVDYGAFHDEEQGHVEVEQLIAGDNLALASEPSQRVVPRPRTRSAVVVAVTAAVVTTLLIGAIPLLVANRENPQADTMAPGTWSEIPDEEGVFGGDGQQQMSSVTAGGPGFVAVGGDGLHEGGHAAVWTSVDGNTWSRVPHDEAVFGGGEPYMTSVIAGGPGLVAVGWNLEAPGDADAAIWTSSDGITWSRVPHDELVFGGSGYQRIWAVTAGGPGLVAVGEDRSRDPDSGDLAVWTSVDGIIWSRIPPNEAIFGTGQFTSVTSADSGLIVAVGNEGSDDGDAAAAWTSPDGVTWSRVPHDEQVFGGAGMKDVTAGGPGFVAVGWSEAEAVAWTSVDGFTWSRIPHDEVVFGDATGMQSVVAGVEGLVAVGHDQSDRNGAAVWASPDGINWSRVRSDDVFGGSDGAGMEGVAFGGRSLVAVGIDGTNAAVWVMPLDH